MRSIELNSFFFIIEIHLAVKYKTNNNPERRITKNATLIIVVIIGDSRFFGTITWKQSICLFVKSGLNIYIKITKSIGVYNSY